MGEDVRVPCGMGMVKRKVANGKRRVESHKVGKNEVQNQPPEHYQAEQRLVQCQRIFPEQSQQAPNLVSFLTVRCGPAVRSRSRTLLCPGRCAPISRAHITTLLQGMKSKVYSKGLKGSGKGSLALIGRLVLNVCGSFLTRFPTHKAGGSSSRSQAELQRCTEE